MQTLSPLEARGKSSEPFTFSSTGSCASDWRAWWQHESRLVGSDWKTLLECAEAVLQKLRAAHVSS
jgi:hypothetical protein